MVYSAGVKYLWVRDKKTGHHYSVPEHAIKSHHEVLTSVPPHNVPKRTKLKVDLKKDNKTTGKKPDESPNAGNEKEG